MDGLSHNSINYLLERQKQDLQRKMERDSSRRGKRDKKDGHEKGKGNDPIKDMIAMNMQLLNQQLMLKMLANKNRDTSDSSEESSREKNKKKKKKHGKKRKASYEYIIVHEDDLYPKTSRHKHRPSNSEIFPAKEDKKKPDEDPNAGFEKFSGRPFPERPKSPPAVQKPQTPKKIDQPPAALTSSTPHMTSQGVGTSDPIKPPVSKVVVMAHKSFNTSFTNLPPVPKSASNKQMFPPQKLDFYNNLQRFVGRNNPNNPNTPAPNRFQVGQPGPERFINRPINARPLSQFPPPPPPYDQPPQQHQYPQYPNLPQPPPLRNPLPPAPPRTYRKCLQIRRAFLMRLFTKIFIWQVGTLVDKKYSEYRSFFSKFLTSSFDRAKSRLTERVKPILEGLDKNPGSVKLELKELKAAAKQREATAVDTVY